MADSMRQNKPDEQLLEPIRPRRASDQIFEQLRDLILRGRLKPGERLMGERDMAARFEVSRPTVREAIHRLADRGLIEHRRGVGAFVLPPGGIDSPPLLKILGGQGIDPKDLVEVRMALECSGVRYAAERADRDDIGRLEANLACMAEEFRTGALSIDEDIAFHMNIAFATHNVVHIHLMRSFHDLLQYIMERLYKDFYAVSGADQISLEQHAAMVEAIRRRDPDAAEAVMREQLGRLLELAKLGPVLS